MEDYIPYTVCHFEYLVMPFGFTNALVTFQHVMNDVFHAYLDDFVDCYIDGILKFFQEPRRT
jgi:hypothetical protein